MGGTRQQYSSIKKTKIVLEAIKAKIRHKYSFMQHNKQVEAEGNRINTGRFYK